MADAPGVPSLFNFSDPNTSALLGALQGLGAASATSRLPVTGGQVFGSLAGGMLSGAEQGAKMRAMDTAQIGEAAKNQQLLDNMTIGRQWLGQGAPSSQDLLRNRYQQLQIEMPNPGTASPSAPGALTPAPISNAASAVRPLSLIKQYESNNNYNVGYGGADLSKAPLDEYGFPSWEGKDGSHAAGAYQFEPATWRKYASQLGIKDFSPESQDAVARLAYLNEGFSPWTPYNPRLAKAVAQKASAGSLDGEPLLPGPSPTQAAAGSLGSLAPGGATVGGVGPLMSQVMGMRYLGMSPPGVITDLMTAQMLPQGPARNLAMSTAYKNAGMAPVQNLRQGGGLAVIGPDGQYHLGMQLPRLAEGQQLAEGPNGEYQSSLIPGTLPAIEQTTKAEAAGKAAYEPQTVIGPGGQPFAVPRTRLQSGQPLPTGLAPQQQAFETGLGAARLKPEEFPGPYGRESLGPASLLAGVGANGQPAVPGALGGAPLAAAAPVTAPTLVPGGALPNTAALTAGISAAINKGRQPEAATPTFPVQTPAGQTKDLSSVTIGDMFPGGQGIPRPPTPPPGMTYGQPSETEKEMQKDDANRVEGYAKEASENQKIYQDLAHLQGVLRRGLTTSKLAPLWSDLGNIAQGMGVPVPKLAPGQDPNNAAVFQKASTDLVFAAVKKLAGAVKVAEIEGYKQASPNLTLPVAANLNILNDMLATSKWQDARARLATEYVTQTGGAPLSAFDARYNQMAPLVDVTDAYKNAMRQTPTYQMGLAKGIGFPEDLGAAAPAHNQPGAPTGATDTRVLGGKTYYKIGGQWVQ